MTYTSKIFISLSLLLVIGAASASAQIVFRRGGDHVRQAPATEQPPIRSAPTGEELNNAFALGLRDFVIERDENTATIKFKAPAGSAPTVEIGLEPPRQGPSGKLEFPSRLSLVQADIVPDKNALQQINFKADLSDLDRGTRYYYLVSTSNARLQTQGRFATVKRQINVTVVFTEIRVLRGEADIFDFWVNGKHLGWIGQTDNQLNWDSESGAHSINQSIEILDAPDVLEIQANGCEDTLIFFEENGCGGNVYDHTVQHKEPINERGVDLNVAIQVVNLTELTGRNVRREFQIESKQSEVDLAFRIKGYFIITRD